MPLLNKKSKKEKVKMEVSSNNMEKIKEYMSWSDIHDFGYFFEECANYVMKSDKEWKRHKKSKVSIESSAEI